MGTPWQTSYNELEAYIGRQPSIAINPSGYSIPSEVRPEFYRLFDAVREAFIRDRFPASLEQAVTLSECHETLRQELIASLALEDIEARSAIREFLKGPLAQLSRLLFDPLFDLLSRKIDVAAFTESATTKVQSALDTFYQQAFQSWLMLALLGVLEPDAVYTVPAQLNEFANEADSVISDSGSLPKQMVPDAVEACRFSFDLPTFVSFLIPRVIVHSKRVDLFASLVTEFRTVPLRAIYYNEKMEWKQLSDIYSNIGRGKTWPDLALYLAQQQNDLIIAADNINMARPDIIFHIERASDLSEPERLEMIRNRYEVFQPRLGSYIITMDYITPEEVAGLNLRLQPKSKENAKNPTQEQEGNDVQAAPPPTATAPAEAEYGGIKIISCAYDKSNLEPIIRAIKAKLETKASEDSALVEQNKLDK
jgi:hypothetical protein